MRLIILTVLMALATSGCATISPKHEVNIHMGLGKNVIRNQLGLSSDPFERMLSGAYKLNITENFYVKPELGGYLAYGPGRKNSFYIGAIAGAQVDTVIGMYINAGLGPAFLTAPDSVVLSGHVQYLIEIGMGFCGEKLCLGGRYCHISNAHGFPLIGGPAPNRGMDVFQGQLSWKFN